MRPNIRIHFLTALCCLAVVLMPLSAAAQGKQATFDQLDAIGAQYAAAKGSPAASALLTQYIALSDQLGGDDPAGLRSAPVDPRRGPSRAAPMAPAGATATTTNFTNMTPVAIVDNTTVMSTITVATTDTYLFDLDLTTTITHTFAADLEITLMSPAGTVVTVTTDNGGGNDDVFAGSLFDDQAGTPATDFTYANMVTATPLIPEGAFGAFIGEDPNGDWTLSVNDDAGGDTGSLDSWALDVTTLDATPIFDPVVNAQNNTPTPIVDNTSFDSMVTVAAMGTYLCDVNMTTDITHTFAADLEISLMSPAGTSTVITTDNGGGNDDVFSGTLWDDSADAATDFTYTNLVTATPLAPEGALAAFIGEDPNGDWTLTVNDDAGGDTGSLNSWSLDIVTCVGDAAGGPGALPIPTVSPIGLGLLFLILALAAVTIMRRKQQTV